jgi:hypothetical protein
MSNNCRCVAIFLVVANRVGRSLRPTAGQTFALGLERTKAGDDAEFASTVEQISML